ncbi:MAG: FAD-dependent 5-carboxymethylaminomethyl-2-thiouridine(34) oxidoreductase MnmC [Pseudomonadota bacterium]
MVKTARLSWQPANHGTAQGSPCDGPADGDAPFADEFDDIYFSGDGPAEVSHVFLAANDLPQRLAHASSFLVGELGFGSALNFLSCWALWDRVNNDPGARLHFFSIEKHPLTVDDFRKAAKAWPELAPYAEKLSSVWPEPVAGFHRVTFGRVTLTLFLGDVMAGLNALTAQSSPSFDCWFLDGFSPAKNPAMWTVLVFQALAKLSIPTITLSTFTAAGQIRRNLESAGFIVSRVPGYGRKRHMIRAHFNATQTATTINPEQNADTPAWASLETLSPLPHGAQIAIIGGGIAGASLCHALRAAGLRPTLFDGAGIAAGASGNPAALVMPRLDQAVSPTSDFFVHAWLHTRRLIDQYRDEDPTLFTECGVIRSHEKPEERARLRDMADAGLLPRHLLRAVEDGLYFQTAGLVDPRRLVKHLIGNTPICEQNAARVIHDDGRVLIEAQDGRTHPFDAVVFANGLNCLRFVEARGLPLTGSVGQLDLYDTPYGDFPAQAFGPYAGPTPDCAATIIGATYDPYKEGDVVTTTEVNRTRNLEAIAAFDTALDQTLDARLADVAVTSRAGVRCVTLDRLPLAGPLPDWAAYGADYDGYRFGNPEKTAAGIPAGRYQPGSFILSGLGSRGIVTAPFCAAMIAAQMTGQIAPADSAIQTLLHPGRFFIRALKRARPRRPSS